LLSFTYILEGVGMGVDRDKLRRRVLYLFCDVADEVCGSEHSHLLATAGKEEEVVAHSATCLDKRQLTQRLGLLEKGDGYPALSVFSEREYHTLVEALVRTARKEKGKPEVDGSLVFTDDGVLDIVHGTRMLNCNFNALEKERGARLEGGIGRSSLAYTSLRDAAGCILKTGGDVSLYESGWRSRLYIPSRKEVVQYSKGTKGESHKRRAIQW